MKMTLALFAAVLAAAAVAEAGEPQGALEPTQKYIESQKKADEEGPDPELETEHYSRQLNLADEQKKKVRALFEEQRRVFKKSYALRTRFQEETEALHRRILELNKKFESEGQAIEGSRGAILKRVRDALTDKQKKTFDLMQEQRAKQERNWKERHEAEDRRRGGLGPMGEPHGEERR